MQLSSPPPLTCIPNKLHAPYFSCRPCTSLPTTEFPASPGAPWAIWHSFVGHIWPTGYILDITDLQQPAELFCPAHQAISRPLEVGDWGCGYGLPLALVDMAVGGRKTNKGWYSPRYPPDVLRVATATAPTPQLLTLSLPHAVTTTATSTSWPVLELKMPPWHMACSSNSSFCSSMGHATGHGAVPHALCQSQSCCQIRTGAATTRLDPAHKESRGLDMAQGMRSFSGLTAWMG